MMNKQVIIKLEILHNKLEILLDNVKNLDFDCADNKDRDNLLYTLQECVDRAFELKQAVQTL